jgi:hypothetical protein
MTAGFWDIPPRTLPDTNLSKEPVASLFMVDKILLLKKRRQHVVNVAT